MASGQTLNDRLTAARHALAGQGLARIVCKATTEEIIGPKKKHLDYLLHCTNEPNVSIPQLANLLIERTQQASWVVVFKALVTVHHLMCYGNERFTQYLASSNCTFQLSGFLDKQGYDMSTFIRRYAKYLNEKAMSYRAVAFDFCKAKRGKEDGTLRTMPTEKLLKALPTLQAQLDALVEFDCTSNDLTNGVINSCFMLLFRDLIRLFACYNDGIINLLEKFFDMNKKNCREALDIYKKFLIRMDRVAELLKVAENVGIDKGDIPDLTKAPSSLLDALEQHLAVLEGKRGPNASSGGPCIGNQPNLKHAVVALQNTSNSFTRASNGSPDINGAKTDESIRRAIEEEADALIRMQEMRMGKGSPDTSPPASTKTNPFLASPEPSSQNNHGLLDLFSSPPSQQASDKDLLGLSGASSVAGNPFADSLFGTAPSPTQSGQSIPFVSFDTPSNGMTANSSTGFGTEVNFAAAFGSDQSTAGFDTFGDVLQPQSSTLPSVPPMPASKISTESIKSNTGPPPSGPAGLIKGDLDSCLASLCDNLSINNANIRPTSHQWGSPKMSGRTGGQGWVPPTATLPNMGWSGQNFPPQAAGGQWAGAPPPKPAGPMGAPFSQSGSNMPQSNFSTGLMRPMGMQSMGNLPPAMGQQPQANLFGAPNASRGQAPPVNDPFGAL